MKLMLAPDSFKESMTAVEAVEAMARGVRQVHADADLQFVPMADGGEGTTATLASALGAELLQVEVQDALARTRLAHIAWKPEAALAVLDVAEACGLEHIEEHERDPRVATSYGVGLTLMRALDLGARRIIVGLGGSATNDAGAGMMQALGARLVDSTGKELAPGGTALADLAELDTLGLDRRLGAVQIQLACDVTNPLLGPNGASVIFGPQKGADKVTVTELDAALANWADVVEKALGREVRSVPGAGAAGGLGAAFMAFFGADVCPGVELVLDAVGFDDKLQGADFVFTGEGCVDAQSRKGKVPWGVAARAHALGIPTIVFGGRVSADVELEASNGVLAIVPIGVGPTDLPSALSDGASNLERAVARVCRLLSAPRPLSASIHQSIEANGGGDILYQKL